MALTPPVRRHRAGDRRNRAAFVAGAVAGGGTIGAVLFVLSGFATPIPATVSSGLIVATATLALVEVAGVPIPHPQSARQIPRSAFDGGTRGVAGFGFELGTGVRTYLTTPVPYVAAAAVVFVAGPWWQAVLVGCSFGLARGWLPVSRAFADDPQAWDQRVDRWRQGSVAATILVVTVAALVGRGLVP